MPLDAPGELNKCFEKIFSDKPKSLYHYTTFEGLLGIIDSEELWMTDLKFLDDPSEILHGHTIIRGVINSLKEENNEKNTFSDNEIDALSFLEGKYEDPFVCPVYSVSFCEEKDLRSQWKGYSKGETGCSIEFNVNEVRNNKIQDKVRPLLGKVLYKNDDKEDAVKKLIESMIKTRVSLNNDNILYLILNRLYALSLFMKGLEFEEEKEWRAVFLMEQEQDFKRELRSGDLSCVKLPIKKLQDVVSEIMTGPKFDYELNSLALQHRVNRSKISVSRSNLR